MPTPEPAAPAGDEARLQAATLEHCLRAETLLRSGKGEEAEAIARAAVEAAPNEPQAWDTLGAILAERGKLPESRACCEAAVRLDPARAGARSNLALVLQRLGEPDEAHAQYLQAIAAAPDLLHIRLNHAALLQRLGRYDAALAAAEQILERDPGMVDALLLAADLETLLGRDRNALARLDRAASGPGRAMALAKRALVLGRLGRWDEALADSHAILNLAPHDGAAHHVRALVLQGMNRPEPALDALQAARAFHPRPAMVMTHRATLLAELGRNDEAQSELEQALALQPDLADAWYIRAGLTRFTPGHTDLARMEAVADAPGATARDRAYLGFALARAYLELGDGGRAFARLNEAARLKRATISYDMDLEAQSFAVIAQVAAEAHARGHARGHEPGFRSTRPIFVFGMPRSGTTLVEQILASHPLVHGAGESAHLGELLEAQGAGFAPGDFARLGRRYLERVGADAPEPLRIVDKTPLNFLHAGLIPLILPGAKMIHCRRDPLDTCLSCYSLLFSRGHDYAYDQRELGHFYNLYRWLMERWRELLPAGAMFELDYESLAGDPEPQIRRLLDFCELPWDARCLRFHETGRRITSASLHQVRRPIYTASIGRAQLFRPWLAELEAELGRWPG